MFNCARVTRGSELIGTARSSRCSSRSTRDTRSIRGDQLDNRCRRRHLIFWGAAAGIASGGPAGSSRLAEEDNRPVDHHRTGRVEVSQKALARACDERRTYLLGILGIATLLLVALGRTLLLVVLLGRHFAVCRWRERSDIRVSQSMRTGRIEYII